ncbi:MAG: hypothetical protein KAI06_08250 [Anaerolineales bacterium]|nr:hypothetical protein [Anaerolineales bacterium]
MDYERQVRICGLVITLICGLLISCGPSQAQLDTNATEVAKDIFQTLTAEVPPPTKTSVPTSTPTKTPTPTSTPRPLSDAIVGLEELPSGFRLERLDDYDVDPGRGKGFIVPVVESGFAYMLDAEDFEVIVGQTELLANRSEKAEFDFFAQNFIDLFVNNTAQAISGQPASGIIDIPGLEDIGEISSGATGNVGGTPSLKMDVVFFRRGKLGAVTWIFYFEGDDPVVPVSEVARKLDANIIDLLDLE